MDEDFSIEIEHDDNDRILFNILKNQTFPLTLSQLNWFLCEKLKEKLFGRIHLVSPNSNDDEEKVKNNDTFNKINSGNLDDWFSCNEVC